MKTVTTTLARTTYGELVAQAASTDLDRAALNSARALVGRAESAKKIPAQFDNMEWGTSGKERGKRIGEARHHEVYDFTGSAVLVCVRSVEGTRYGQKTTLKEYFLVQSQGRGVTVKPASKAVAAKAAKAAGNELGLAVAVCQGKRPAPAPKCMAPRTGFKIVRRAGDGFVSVWDDSGWHLGQARVEAATPDHNGGFYFYAGLDEAIEQAVSRQTFAAERGYHDLSILEVEVAGREFGSTKRCATRVRPLREVCAIL